MLSVNGKNFMTLPEAVQWLLDNNALPFQSTASFAPDTEIAKSTIINPSPAEIKIGSLVLFADGKVGTVSAITSNGFKVGQDATDLADGVPHVTDIQINASGHLIITMSEGDPIDAGLIKQVSSMSIDASQHLIVHYNDGTTNDLGPIFQGNVNISGNLTADSIVENMAGYGFSYQNPTGYTLENVYVGAVKNGNKLTLVTAFNITKTDNDTAPDNPSIGYFMIPSSVGEKLYETLVGSYNYLSNQVVYAWQQAWSRTAINATMTKGGNTQIFLTLVGAGSNLTLNTKYYIRMETTFLLSNGLV